MIFMFPCNYIHITQLFKEGTHNGLDLRNYISQAGSQDILAPYDGEVVGVRNNYITQDKTGSSYGNYVKIKHNDEFTTLIAHLKLNSVIVKVGDKVSKGDKIAIMGTTGHSTGIHAHYEVFKNNKKVNPLLYTYVHVNQTVYEASKSYVNYYKQINSVAKDINVDQLKINVTNLSIRQGPGTTFNRIGFAVKDGIYNFYESITKDDYTWFRIGDDSWVANDGNYLTIYEKNKLKENNNETNYKFKFFVEKTGYYKIKLNNGENLYIK